EALEPGSQYSQLNHEWQFDIIGNRLLTFNVSGFHTSDTEAFRFEYSTDHSNWRSLNVELTNASQTLSAELPERVSGSLYVRIVDTDHTPGETTLDRVYIDDLYLFPLAEPNIALANLAVSDVNTSEDASGTPVAQFIVTRTGPLDQTITVGFQTVAQSATADEDFVSQSLRALVIPAGVAAATIGIPIIDDGIAEGDETFAVELKYALYANIVDAIGIATIAASDPPPAPQNAVQVTREPLPVSVQSIDEAFAELSSDDTEAHDGPLQAALVSASFARQRLENKRRRAGAYLS
ncbi:MAG: hypothetical protein KDA92_22930, partial [Planctomycetales bacterium]|nr:hypothetical protein [Planctomycetales bacterium]